MTKDLEATLDELGPEYRTVVERLRAPFADRKTSCGGNSRPLLVAASALAAVALAVVFARGGRHAASGPSVGFRDVSAPYAVYTAAYATDEFALRAILDSQRADGSWTNDYLTMQNAAALRRAHDDASRIAYKRAVRYLRSKGLNPLSDSELKARSARAPQGFRTCPTTGV